MEQNSVRIEQIKSLEGLLDKLSDLLVEVVDQGASVGFLPPLNPQEARDYWNSVISSDTILFIARMGNQLVGTVQLQLATKENGRHRAEIAKLMTHPNFRRLGVAQSLMKTAEEKAIEEGRSLLVLDTREGDPSNKLYVSIGYQFAGQIPNFAKSANGAYHATNFYYKNI